MKQVQVIRQLEADLRSDINDWRKWLVYADWLQEQGDARGQLIVMHHRWWLHMSGEYVLSRYEADMLDKQMKKFYAEYTWNFDRDKIAVYECQKHFFPTSVGFAAVSWPPGGMMPSRDVYPVELFKKFTQSQDGRLLTSASFFGQDEQINHIDETEALEQITHLMLDGAEITDADIQRYAASPRMKQLKTLKIIHSKVSDDCTVYFNRKTFPNLTELDLSHGKITAAGVQVLQSSELVDCELILEDHCLPEEWHTM